MLDKMLLPGQIENWMVLCDMCRLGLGNISISSLKQVMGILQVNYKCRLGNNFIVNTPKSLWVVWSCVKPFVDEITIEKVKIAKGLHSDEMLAMFNPGQVEEKYGGKAKNLTNYWPPTVPDSPFAVPGKLSLLTEKDSYFQHYSKEDTIEDDSSEIIEKYEEEKQECSVNSLEIEESDVEFDLETDHAVMCRSQLGQNEVLEDFENAMPFTKTYERNPTFKDISKRDSEVFLASHSIKNLHEDLEIINSSNNAESSRYTIIEAEEVTQCRLLGCEGMNCVSF